MNGPHDRPIPSLRAAATMREAAEAIARATEKEIRGLHERYTSYSGTVRNAGSGLENAATPGPSLSQIVSDPGSRGPWLIGWDGRYRHFTFESRQIRSMPLVDHTGRVIGVSFPTRVTGQSKPDREHYAAWSRMPDRRSDTEFVPEARRASGRNRESWEELGPPVRAPWADSARDGLLYVHAHATRRGFEIEANVGTDDAPDWRILLAPGRFFGHVLAANRHFREASLASPRRPALMLACDAGNPEYGHAAQAAEVLHDAGMRHDVYATVGVNRARVIEEDGVSWLGVEVPDGTSPTDAVVTIRAPDEAVSAAAEHDPPLSSVVAVPAELREGTRVLPANPS
ncbi:hypothetical protein [Nocardia sp. NPDC003963]